MKKRNSTELKRKALHVAVAAIFTVTPAWANPTNPSVASGKATFNTAGSSLTVTNTPNAIINWASFGINAGEAVRFVQQSSASAVLNRVTGINPSQILGTLQSNGRVFLINPHGLVFGAGAVIDTAGFVASTLNMKDEDFLNGRMRFNADTAKPGNISNAGEIKTPTGGFVWLIAPNVENSGIINTPSGEAILAAGNSVELVDSNDPNQRVKVSATSKDVNLSQMMLQNNGNIFAVLNSGKVSANTAVVGQNGKVYFKSAGDIRTTASSVVEAKGDASMEGGHIQAFADGSGKYEGFFDVSGKNGGFLETSGEYLDVANIQLKGNALDVNGHGGTWLLDPYDYYIDAHQAGAISLALNSGLSVFVDTNYPNAVSGSPPPSGSPVTPYGGSASTGLGDITVASGITWDFNNTLSLNAQNNILIQQPINAIGGGNITLNAVNNITVNSQVLTGGTINAATGTNGGVYLDAAAAGVSTLLRGDLGVTVNAGTGGVWLRGGTNVTSEIYSLSGPVSIYTNGGLHLYGGVSIDNIPTYGGLIGANYAGAGVWGASVSINSSNGGIHLTGGEAHNQTYNADAWLDAESGSMNIASYGSGGITLHGGTSYGGWTGAEIYSYLGMNLHTDGGIQILGGTEGAGNINAQASAYILAGGPLTILTGGDIYLKGGAGSNAYGYGSHATIKSFSYGAGIDIGFNVPGKTLHLEGGSDGIENLAHIHAYYGSLVIQGVYCADGCGSLLPQDSNNPAIEIIGGGALGGIGNEAGFESPDITLRASSLLLQGGAGDNSGAYIGGGEPGSGFTNINMVVYNGATYGNLSLYGGAGLNSMAAIGTDKTDTHIFIDAGNITLSGSNSLALIGVIGSYGCGQNNCQTFINPSYGSAGNHPFFADGALLVTYDGAEGFLSAAPNNARVSLTSHTGNITLSNAATGSEFGNAYVNLNALDGGITSSNSRLGGYDYTGPANSGYVYGGISSVNLNSYYGSISLTSSVVGSIAGAANVFLASYGGGVTLDGSVIAARYGFSANISADGNILINNGSQIGSPNGPSNVSIYSEFGSITLQDTKIGSAYAGASTLNMVSIATDSLYGGSISITNSKIGSEFGYADSISIYSGSYGGISISGSQIGSNLGHSYGGATSINLKSYGGDISLTNSALGSYAGAANVYLDAYYGGVTLDGSTIAANLAFNTSTHAYGNILVKNSSIGSPNGPSNISILSAYGGITIQGSAIGSPYAGAITHNIVDINTSSSGNINITNSKIGSEFGYAEYIWIGSAYGGIGISGSRIGSNLGGYGGAPTTIWLTSGGSGVSLTNSSIVSTSGAADVYLEAYSGDVSVDGATVGANLDFYTFINAHDNVLIKNSNIGSLNGPSNVYIGSGYGGITIQDTGIGSANAGSTTSNYVDIYTGYWTGGDISITNSKIGSEFGYAQSIWIDSGRNVSISGSEIGSKLGGYYGGPTNVYIETANTPYAGGITISNSAIGSKNGLANVYIDDKSSLATNVTITNSQIGTGADISYSAAYGSQVYITSYGGGSIYVDGASSLRAQSVNLDTYGGAITATTAATYLNVNSYGGSIAVIDTAPMSSAQLYANGTGSIEIHPNGGLNTPYYGGTIYGFGSSMLVGSSVPLLFSGESGVYFSSASPGGALIVAAPQLTFEAGTGVYNALGTTELLGDNITLGNAYGGANIQGTNIRIAADNITLNNTNIYAYGGGNIYVFGQNIALNDSNLSGGYVGLNYDPLMLGSITGIGDLTDLFNFLPTSTVNINAVNYSSGISGFYGAGVMSGTLNLTSSGPGSAYISSNQFVDILTTGKATLTAGSGNAYVSAAKEVYMASGGQLVLESGTYKGTGSGHAWVEANPSLSTIYLDFPLLSDNGYMVDGLTGTIISSLDSLTGFFDGGLPAVLNSTMFVRYFGGVPQEVDTIVARFTERYQCGT